MNICGIWQLSILLLAVDTATAQPAPQLDWHSVSPAHIEGQGWKDTTRAFHRLPAKAKGMVRPPVWGLGGTSAGLNFRFKTDAQRIHVRWTLTSDRIAMSHMPATAVSGLDLYRRQGDKWHFLAVARPEKTPRNETELMAGLAGDDAEYRIYLPLYNGVKEIAVGVPNGATCELLTPDPQTKPLVIYGTSITHGGCASRPGMSYPSILGRRLGTPVINLGFSGNGRAEPEVAELLGEIDAAAYVLDPLPNLGPEGVRDRMPEFLRILRERRPDVPILLVGSVVYPNTAFVATRASRVAGSNRHLKDAFEARIANGDRRLWLVPGCDLSVDEGQWTVDGVHPTDLGFERMADNLEPEIRKVLDLPVGRGPEK